jgi:signal transduction histidine kinase
MKSIGQYCFLFQCILLICFYSCKQSDESSSKKVSDLLIRGIDFNDAEKYDSARICFSEALKIKGGREHSSGRVLVNIGNSYYFEERYDEALKYYLEALGIAEKAGEPVGIVRVAGNMSECYYMLGNATQALHYADYSEKIIMQTDTFIYLRPQVLYIRGSVLLERNELDEAETMMHKVIRVADTCYHRSVAAGYSSGEGSLWYIAYGQEGLSKIALARNDFDKAVDFAQQSIATAERGDFPAVKAKCLTNLSSVYLKMKDYKKCLSIAGEALAASPYIIKKEPVLAHNIAVANIFLGNNEAAVRYADIYSSQMRKNTAKNFRETLASMATQYETEKKQQHIQVLEQRQYLLLALIIAGVTLTIAVWIILHQKIMHEKREKQLVAVNAVLDGEKCERERLARDLHDGLGGQLSALRLEIAPYKNKSALRQLDDCITSMRNISRGLYPVSLSKLGLKAALEDFCKSLPNARLHFFGKERKFDERAELMIYYCAYELINNSLKHSGAKNIDVQLIQSGNNISLTVQDDGCGFDLTSVKMGLGLKNLNDRVASLEGKILVDSNEKGTETTIEFKIKNGRR